MGECAGQIISFLSHPVIRIEWMRVSHLVDNGSQQSNRRCGVGSILNALALRRWPLAHQHSIIYTAIRSELHSPLDSPTNTVTDRAGCEKQPLMRHDQRDSARLLVTDADTRSILSPTRNSAMEAAPGQQTGEMSGRCMHRRRRNAALRNTVVRNTAARWLLPATRPEAEVRLRCASLTSDAQRIFVDQK